jgi:preprotein translocase subunit SecG
VNALLVTLNILAGLFLIGVVLLQSGKGADMGAVFGGASSTVFGPSGAGNVLTKLTVATAVVFMLSSLLLAVLSAQQSSVFDDFSAEPAAVVETVPAAQESTGGGMEDN